MARENALVNGDRRRHLLFVYVLHRYVCKSFDLAACAVFGALRNGCGIYFRVNFKYRTRNGCVGLFHIKIESARTGLAAVQCALVFSMYTRALFVQNSKAPHFRCVATEEAALPKNF